MRHRIVILVVLALLSGWVSPAAAQTAAPALVVVPEQVVAGQVVKVQGNGFRARARLASWLTAADQSVLSGPFALVSNKGTFEIEARIPAGAIGGRWAITLFDPQDRSTTVAHFEVQGRTPGTEAAAPARVAPPNGAAGTRFAFSAQGFEARERVSYWLTGPDGQVAAAFPEGTRANADGRIDIVWPSPTNAASGVWVITFQGISSGTARAVPFRIE